MSNQAEVEKIAHVFPGQGSQYVGMGKELFKKYDSARTVFATAEDVLGVPVKKWCFEGPQDLQNDTRITQPAIFVTSIAHYMALMDHGFEPDIVAGHSLGEYSALVASGTTSFEDGLRLVDSRAKFMAEAGQKNPGAMAAVQNIAIDSLTRICRSTGAYIANYNTPKQTVISGAKNAISATVEYVQLNQNLKAVAKRLPISIAAHSPLMQDASDKLKTVVAKTNMRIPSINIISNSTAELFAGPDDIRQSLPDQLTKGVLWWQTIEKMLSMGVVEIKEVGPKNVLSKMIGRALAGSSVKITAVDT